MREQLVAQFESAGDERRMFVAAEGEKIVVREELSGPAACDRRLSRVGRLPVGLSRERAP